MRAGNIGTVLGYSVAAVMGLFGIAVLAGIASFSALPMQFRITFGIVLLLFCIYRAAITYTQSRQQEDDDE
jgi:hypothetical protein